MKKLIILLGIIIIAFFIIVIYLFFNPLNDIHDNIKHNTNSIEKNNSKEKDFKLNDNNTSLKEVFDDNDNFEEPMSFIFSSGVGAWRTTLELYEDGTFNGVYRDTQAGDSGENYLATAHVAFFEGTFDNVERIDSDSYSLELISLEYEHDIGEKWIEDEVRYIAAEAYGLSDGEKFYLYTPDKYKASLSDEVLSWMPYLGENEIETENLGQWAIQNVETNNTFYTYEE